jgi:hypothetical protein
MRLLNAFKDLTAEELRNIDVTQRVLEYHGDMLPVGMDTTEGATKRLTVAWDNLGEAMAKVANSGGVIVGVIDTITTRIQGVADLFEGREWWKIYAGMTGGLLSGAGVAGMLFGVSEAGKFAAPPGAAPPATGPGGVSDPGMMIGEIDVFKVAAEQKRAAEARRRADLAAVQTYVGDTGVVEGAYGGPEYGSRVPEETALKESRAKRRMNAEEMVTKYYDDQAMRRLEISAREAADQDKILQARADNVREQYESMGMMAMQGMSLAFGAIEALVDGGIEGFLKYAANAIQSIGTQLLASGLANQARAIAMDAFLPGSGVALRAAATNEIALGTAMAAGGFAAGLGIKIAGRGGDAGGGGGGGGQSRSFDGSAGYRSRDESGGDRSITIILQGPVYGGAAAGVAIMERVAEARKHGLLR